MTGITVRPAVESDVDNMTSLLHEKHDGSTEPPTDMAPFIEAFRKVNADPDQHILIAVEGNRIIGTIQVTVIPGFAYGGGAWAQLSGFRVVRDLRRWDANQELVKAAVNIARRHHCTTVQSNCAVAKGGLQRVLEKSGFQATHIGHRLSL